MKSICAKVGCSGWYYWHWKATVYPAGLPSSRWFEHYQSVFDTVELNAPFYHWPKPATVQNWARQAKPGFQYSVKVNRQITHIKRFQGTKRLIGEFSRFADVLGASMGYFLFQLPPGYHYTPARLTAITEQLEPHRRNAVEFRHRSWWNKDVFDAFEKAGIVFCSVSAPRLPDDLVATGGVIYIRFHGATQWYRHDYSQTELETWAEKIKRSGATEVWAYFNNDFQGCAFRNAQTLKQLLG